MRQPVRVLADQHIYLTERMLPKGVELERFNPSEGVPGELARFDALLIRTVTPVDKQSLPEGTGQLRFIGSATAGYDHVDREYLNHLGIPFAWSPGCNAIAVGEYVGTALVHWAIRTGHSLDQLTAGVIGVGHAGEATAQVLERLGLTVVRHDPPREERETGFRSASLDQTLMCDLLTFHTPLSRSGPHPTWHWLDKAKLAGRTFRLVINASRGGVIDEGALWRHYKEKRIGSWVLDVWENEPRFRDRMARHATIATPHVAGYSIQAKIRASIMILEALCQTFDLELPAKTDAVSTPREPILPAVDDTSLADLLNALNPLLHYDRLFRKLIGRPAGEKVEGFSRIRTGEALRTEHALMPVHEDLLNRYSPLRALGFSAK